MYVIWAGTISDMDGMISELISEIVPLIAKGRHKVQLGRIMGKL